MNNAGVDLTFCVIFCSKLMAACKIADCGNMFLTPVLELATTSQREQHFQAKFRYRAKVRYPEERDGHRVSYGQLQRDDLLRPFSKSAGLALKSAYNHTVKYKLLPCMLSLLVSFPQFFQHTQPVEADVSAFRGGALVARKKIF